MKRFTTQVEQFFQSTRTPSNCNAIFIKNTSATVPLYVNNVLVPPGNIFTVSGNEGEIDVTEYFIDMKGVPGEVLVIKKMYV